MWRAWPILKWVALFVFLALLTNIAAGLFFSDPKIAVLRFLTGQSTFLAVLIVAILFGVLCLLSWSSHKRHLVEQHVRELKSQFSIFTTSEKLTPEHLGFVRVEIGQQYAPGRRPHYPPHIPRVAVPYDERNAASFSHVWSEEELSALLKAHSGFVLLGEPTVGKSRVLYNAIRRIEGNCVIKPLHHALPSNEALSLCKGFPVIVLLDDLNEFVGVEADLLELTNRLDELRVSWTVAAGCRDGSELGAVKESVGTSLRKFYEQVPHKLSLRLASDDEKRALVLQLQKNISPSDIEPNKYPTLGSITMREALSIMRERFVADLTGVEKDCLRSMVVLTRAGVVPLQHKRIVLTMKSLFGRSTVELRDILSRLDHYGFIRSGEADPVVPEMAYISMGDPAVVNYVDGRSIDIDLTALKEELLRIGDADGVMSMAIGYGGLGDTAAMIEVCKCIIDRFTSPMSDGERVAVAGAIALLACDLRESGRSDDAIEWCDQAIEWLNKVSSRKTGALGGSLMLIKAEELQKRGRCESALGVCDDMLRRYGKVTEHKLLREILAKCLFRKGVILNCLSRIDDAVDSFGEIVVLYGNMPEDTLQQIVAHAILEKATLLASSNRMQDAIQTCGMLERRFGEHLEIKFRELVFKGMLMKGKLLGDSGQREEAIEEFRKIKQRYDRYPATQLETELSQALVAWGALLIILHRDEEARTPLSEAWRYRALFPPELRGDVRELLIACGVTPEVDSTT